MIQKFVDRFIAKESSIKDSLRLKRPEDYDALVKIVVDSVADEGEYESPDSSRIHIIDDGDYQGTRLFIIGAGGYHPSTYWVIAVSYGSCSGCDSFQAARGWGDDPISEREVGDYWTMMLHMVQEMKQIAGYM